MAHGLESLRAITVLQLAMMCWVASMFCSRTLASHGRRLLRAAWAKAGRLTSSGEEPLGLTSTCPPGQLKATDEATCCRPSALMAVSARHRSPPDANLSSHATGGPALRGMPRGPAKLPRAAGVFDSRLLGELEE